VLHQESAISLAFKAITFIVADDTLRDRFLALSGLSPDEIRANLPETTFQASILEFLVSHEPDLIAFAKDINETPEQIVKAWRTLGGGVGQEW